MLGGVHEVLTDEENSQVEQRGELHSDWRSLTLVGGYVGLCPSRHPSPSTGGWDQLGLG